MHDGRVGVDFALALALALAFAFVKQLAIQQIRSDCVNRRLQLAWIATALVTCLHTGRPHQSSYTVLTARQTGIGKVAHDAW